MDMRLTTRPLTDRAWIGAKPRTRSQFTATYSDTLNLLEREVYALQTRGMDDPVLMIDITEADLRLDGQVRANARPASDAVALAFESKRGPLVFRADRYDSKPWGSKMDGLWQHNLRAIALTLEALRAVDRYGATQSGEQYVGYRQIEARTAGPQSTPDQARAGLRAVAGDSMPYDATDADLVRIARRETHPDRRGGDRTAWDLVEKCATVLGVQS